MKIARMLLLIVLLSHQLSAFDYKTFLCGVATNRPFLDELLSNVSRPEKRNGKGKSKVSKAEEQFVRQVLEEQKILCAQTVDIVYAPPFVEGWSSIAYRDRIEVPKTGKSGTAYIEKERKSSAALLERYNVDSIDSANLTKAINTIASAKYLNMELAEALNYRGVITKLLENNANLPEGKSIYAHALGNIEKSLKAHKGAILHEYGHIANNHGTNKKEVSNLGKYALPGYAVSVAAGMALQKCTKPEQVIIPLIASYLCSQLVVTFVRLYAQRAEEAEADSYNQSPEAIKYLRCYFKTQQLVLHQKLKYLLGTKYSKLCESKHIERLLNFLIDPEHPSLLSRIEYCKMQLKKRKR